MSDPSEQSEATQQEAGSTQANAEGRVEATEAAERKAQELGVDLTNVEGTGPGGRVTAPDVENAHRETDTTARSAEEIIFTQPEPCTPPQDPTGQDLPCPTCTPPSHAEILEQYLVLKATLAGPIGPVNLCTEQIATKFDANRNPIDAHPVLECSAIGITKINFPLNPCNFFAPTPPSAPVKWTLPSPQPLLPRCLTGTCQRCLGGQCNLDINIDIGVSNTGAHRSVGQQPLASSGIDTSDEGRKA